MAKITLETEIIAPIKVCFDLSRSIDLHKISTAKTNEKAIAGKTSGLISLNEYVIWEAVHFEIKQRLTSKITLFKKQFLFIDEQQKGAFKSFKHQHLFTQKDIIVIMRDVFEFESPLGIIGKVLNFLVLKSYMKKLLLQRNEVIKEYAETDKWKTVLNEKEYL